MTPEIRARISEKNKGRKLSAETRARISAALKVREIRPETRAKISAANLGRKKSAEARAKIVYERLINFCDDPGSKDALQFLMTREITHMKVFMLALDSLAKDHDFLKKGGVFSQDFIESYIELKMEEVYAFEHTPHPIEFKMYYSV